VNRVTESRLRRAFATTAGTVAHHDEAAVTELSAR